MKNRINWIIVTIVTISLLFSFIGCKDPEPIELDQTAPANVTNLKVVAADGNAVLTWTNPEDDDFAGVQVAMSPAEGTLANAVSLGKDVTSLNVSGLKVGSEYTFTVKSFDTSLNYSTGAEAKATVADTADYEAPANVTNLKVVAADGNAVLTWTNPEDDDFAGVQVAMSPAEGTLANAVSLGKDVTSLNVSGLKVGSEYTFTVKTFDTSLNYSTGATEKATVADTSDTTAPANVTNLVATNIATSVLLEWTDAQDADIFGYEVSWDKTIPVNRSVSMEANTMMIAPKTQGCYVSNLEIGVSYTFTVKSVDLSGNKSAGQTVTLTYTPNNAEISIESVSIPDAGEPYAGGSLPVTIKGNNFKSPYFEVDTLEVEGVKNFQVINNTEINAEIECPSTAGSYTVEVKCGALSKSATYKVVEAEKCFNVGDILFTDGTLIKAGYGVPDTQVEKAFGVVALAPYGGVTGKVVGLQMSSETLPWAKHEPTGYYTNFKEIQADYTYSSSGGYTFTGDLDGSDNWEYICSKDPEGTADAATNYPAFDYALNYGKTAGLEETYYAEGWYIPSAAELYDIYTNKEVVQASLNEVGGSSISTTCWSSSQCANISAYYGSGSSSEKYYGKYVLVIHSIDSDRFTEYVYLEPSITSVTIATAGEGYTGELPVTIIGKNLKGHAITCDDASFGNVKVVTDTKATATITCNGVVGETPITVASGSSNPVEGTVKVIELEKCFDVGDILFTDGTRIKAENVQYGIPESQKDKAFGVVLSAPYGRGTGKIVGLQNSDEKDWASIDTKGYKTNFKEIQADYTYSSSGGYTFTGDLDGSDNWEYICSKDPEGTDTPEEIATNYPAFDYALNYGKTAGLAGTKYEKGWYIPSIAELIDVETNKEVVQKSLDAVGGFDLDTDYWSSCQSASYDKSAYIMNRFSWQVVNKTGVEGIFFIQVLVVQAFNAELFTEYVPTTKPSITSVTIATAGEGYTGELPVTIIGENLKGHAITCSDASFGNVTSVSDTKVTATIICNGVVGETPITVISGSSNPVEGPVKVVEKAKCYSVGDIILTDGSKVSVSDIENYVIEEENKPIGVIASALYGGATGKAVGLQNSSSKMWAEYNTTGYRTNFTGIQAYYTGSSSSGYTFTGDLDGSDNWDYICSKDPEGTDTPEEIEENYPAFYFAEKYGETAGLTGTKYETGWYIPSVAELYDVYKNKEVVQTSLEAVGEFIIGTSYYWSSSQNAYVINKAYQVNFSNGTVHGGYFKDNDYNVLVIQAFNAE